MIHEFITGSSEIKIIIYMKIAITFCVDGMTRWINEFFT